MNDKQAERTTEALERIAAALETLANSLSTPTCGHGTVGFCNACFITHVVPYLPVNR